MAHLSKAKILALDKASALLERQAKPESRQPRFDPRITPSQFFFQIYNWTKELIYDEPKYKADSKKRDEWLRKVVMKEPYLNGVLHSVISVDKNRGWTITGGKTQVKKYTSLLHNFQAAPDIYGWRSGMSVTSQSYYGADIGAIVEVGRTTKNGGLAGLFTVDSTKCSLTGDMDTPLKYTVSRQGDQYWEADDYFRVVSMPSTDEVMNGLGFCAISRCIDLAKLLVGIFEHDREKLGTKAPKGLLLLKGISQSQWLQSLEENESELANLEREYYTGVQVIANDGITDIDARLVPLSNLPENFEHKSFTDMIIYGYALAFGYDPREFWPISGGMVGYGAETTVQHKKATGKGGMDFILSFQEKLQEELPETIQFEFEQRDTDAEMTEVGLQGSKLNVIQQMFATANAAGETLITQLEARQLLAEAQLIPEEWTLQDEEVELEDTEDAGEMIEKSRVQRAIERFPDEDIVSYSWPSGVSRVIKKASMPIRKRAIVVPENKTVMNKDILRIIESLAQRQTGSISIPEVNVTVQVPENSIKVTVPEQRAPIVNITTPTPIVNVAAQPAPVVNVSVPEQKPAVVNVNVPEQPAPVINVNVPEPVIPDYPPISVPEREPVSLKVLRDPFGKIIGIEEE